MEMQETFKIFCGNLSPLTTGNDLHRIFSKYGTVLEADVIPGKNYGFVHMSSETEGMNSLCALQNYLLNGERMVVERAISSKRSSVANIMPIKRNIVGQGIGSLDDFETVSEVNDNFNVYSHDISNFPKHSVSSSSPVSYNISINHCNMSDNSSGRPSPLLLSSTSSSSYTPEHVPPYMKPTENKMNHYENLNMLLNQDNNSVCGMCNEEYNNHIHLPKFLSCNHTFCLDCLTSLAKGFEIKCPRGCPYITTLHEAGVTGLTTNQTKIIKLQEMVSSIPNASENQNNHSYEANVCCICLSTPPGKLCSIQKHTILKESEAFQILKPQLHKMLEFSMNNLRNVMAMQATLKERMQYTLHSLNKFSEELKLKIENEEAEQMVQQSLLVELHETNDTLSNISNINELLLKFSKINASTQGITQKFHHCLAKDTVNGALQSLLLTLKEPHGESLGQLGFCRKEAFSLASTLKENADKGNFANVLLIYLLSDLLFTRYRPNVLNPNSVSYASFSPSYAPGRHLSPVTSLSQEAELQPESEEPIAEADHLFDINAVIETTKAIESSTMLNGSPSSLSDQHPSVSSALSLGLSNFSLIDNKEQGEGTKPFSEPFGQGANAIRPISYLDAVKKPPTKQQPVVENQTKLISKALPTAIKPATKFPHCWMILSINGVTAGRIIFQLRPDKAPNMCDNFIGLCTGRSGYGYKGTHFFKNGDGFLVGGDVENDDGTGGFSVYDKQKFEADLCPLKDDVGMVRFKGIGTSDKGRGMVGSQFMIWYTEREFKKFSFSLVFGKVVDGLEIIQEAANHNLYKVAIKVEECGAINF